MRFVSKKELARRHAALRAAMARDGYDALLVAGNTEAGQRGFIRYTADWRLWGGTAYLLLPLEGEPVLVMGLGSQADYAKAIGMVRDTRPVLVRLPEVISVFREKGLERGRIGVAGLNRIMPHGDAKDLLAAFPQARFEDATLLMEGIMVALSPEEVGYAEETHRAVEMALNRLDEVLAPGKTELEVIGEVAKTAAAHGCLDGIAHVSCEPAGSIRPASERVFQPDDIVRVFLEYYGLNGFFVELGAIFSFRKPSEEKRRKFETTVRAIDRAVELMRPGTPAADLCRAVEATYREDGWKITGRRLWDFHGQGLNSLMPPLGMPESTEILSENMMLNIHPGVLTADGWGASVTNNYIVTPEGGHALGGFQHRWRVVG
ncbi:MAG: aminopeptidase P family protein [Chloroflexi bacterium]|nr:aminopeptidase P family protein [Chloroflexota bacterium]